MDDLAAGAADHTIYILRVDTLLHPYLSLFDATNWHLTARQAL
jgi:hypothetical protein